MSTAKLEEFHELEREYNESPDKYRLKVRLMMWRGYAGLFLGALVIAAIVVVGVIGFATGTFSLVLLDNFAKFAIPLVIVGFITVRSMFVRLPEPDGFYLDGEAKQQVLDFFEPVRQQAHGVRIDEVILENNLNAAVSQQSRFGFWGKNKNYLFLGVPLLQTMSAEHVKAVIAHEFGHLSHEHGKLGAKVYRMNSSLSASARAILDKSKDGESSWAFKKIDKFYQRFNTLTFAMRRGQEYEADRVAATVTSPDAIAQSLCLLSAVQEPWSKHWGEVWDRTREQADIRQQTPYADVPHAIKRHFDPEVGRQSVTESLEVNTDYNDTHPCLRERLEALKVSPSYDITPAESPAFEDIFDSASQNTIVQTIESNWRESAGKNWAEEVSGHIDQRNRIAELGSRVDELGAEELLELAELEERQFGVAQAMPRYQMLQERFSENAWSHYYWAKANIEQDLECAQAAAIRAVEQDIEYFSNADNLLRYGYSKRSLDYPEAVLGSFRTQYEEYVEQAEKERANFSTEDNYKTLDMPEDYRATLQERIKEQFPEIQAMYVVEKVLDKFQNNPELLIMLRVRMMHENVEVDSDKYVDRIQRQMPRHFEWTNGASFILCNDYPSFEEMAKGIEGAQIYAEHRTFWEKLMGSLKIAWWLIVAAAIIFFIVSAVFFDK